MTGYLLANLALFETHQFSTHRAFLHARILTTEPAWRQFLDSAPDGPLS
jgi:hypothetical protein